MTVNVKSPMRLAQLAWPHLKAAGEGKIVVMASLAGNRVRYADGGLYSMSKAAVLMLAHGLRHAGEPHNIRCTAICPGFVATDMAANVGDDIQDKLTRPEDVARIVATVLSLPSTASVAEIPVSWRVEAMFWLTSERGFVQTAFTPYSHRLQPRGGEFVELSGSSPFG